MINKIINKHKAKIITAILLATLMVTLTVVARPTPTTPLFPLTNMPTQLVTSKQAPPTINNLVSTQMQIYPSALDNLTGITDYSVFNETFFNVIPSGGSNLTFASAVVFSNIISAINATAPEPYTPVMPFPISQAILLSTTLNPPEFTNLFLGTYGKSGASVILAFNDTSSSAQTLCNQTLNQVIQNLTNKLNQNGLSPVENVLTKIFVVENNLTLGFALLTIGNTPQEVYNFLVNNIPNGTYEKNMSQSALSSTHKGITMGDMILNNTMMTMSEGYIQFNAVLRGGIIQNAQNNFTFSTRKMLNLPNGINISVTNPGQTLAVLIFPPSNANITGTYPNIISFTGGFFALLPSYLGSSFEDINCTYTLQNEADVPYLAITNYTMVNTSGQTDWNPSPGQSVNLTLTIENVGQANASGISLVGSIMTSTIANFTNGISGSFIFESIPNLNSGDETTIALNITALSSGLTAVQIVIAWQGQPSPTIIQLPIGVGNTGPLVVPFINWSNYVISPGDVVNTSITFTNLGAADAGDSNATIFPFGFITNISMPATFENVVTSGELSMDEVTLDLGSLAINQSVTANITMITDPFFFCQTGSVSGGNSFEVVSNSSLQYVITGPLILPGLRPSNSLFLKVERTPDVIVGNIGDNVTVAVRLSNLGTAAATITVEQLVPQGCELVGGAVNGTVTIGAGEEKILTFEVTISGTISGTSIASANGVAKGNPITTLVPQTTVKYYNMTYNWGYLGLSGAPRGYCSAVHIQLPSNSSLDISLSGNAAVNAEELSANPVGGATGGVNSSGWFLSVTVDNSSAFTGMTLTVHYNKTAVINAGLNESSLGIFTWDGSNWVELSSTVDTVNSIVTATVNHLSYFTLGVPGPLAASASPLPLLVYLTIVTSNSGMGTLYLAGGVVLALALAAVAVAAILYRRRK